MVIGSAASFLSIILAPGSWKLSQEPLSGERWRIFSGSVAGSVKKEGISNLQDPIEYDVLVKSSMAY